MSRYEHVSQGTPHRHSQLRLRHLFGLTAAAAILAAMLAPWLRGLDDRTQVLALVRLTSLLVLVTGAMAYMLLKRHRVEVDAGQPITTFARPWSNLWHWGIFGLFLLVYLGTVVLDARVARPSSSWDFLPGSPIVLYFGVNYFVLYVWWKIDPRGMEACENGLISGGVFFLPWSEINRYTWTGSPPRQLNLFLKSQFVRNANVDSSWVPELEGLLHQHIGTPG